MAAVGGAIYLVLILGAGYCALHGADATQRNDGFRVLRLLLVAAVLVATGGDAANQLLGYLT